MFKIKYNFLVLIQILISILNSVILLKLFGVSYKADVYLMSIAIFSSISLLQLMFVEQFMYFYNDAKTVGNEYAYKFYNFSLFFSLATGLVMFLIFYIFRNFLVELYAFGIDPERRDLLVKSVTILVFSGIFNLALYVNIRFLNAEMHFSLPYILEMIPGFMTLLMLIYSLIFKLNNIEPILIARITGTVISLSISIYFIFKYINVPFNIVLKHKLAASFIKNSISMRFGHNIHNLLFTPITSNILAILPNSYASIFYYAQRLIQIVYSLTTGPSHRVFVVKVSKLFSNKKYDEIKKSAIQYLKIVLILYVAFSVIVFLIIPYILPILSSKLTTQNIWMIEIMFLFLSVWYFILTLESSVTPIGISSKRSKIFITTNTIFIVTYFFISFFLKEIIGIYSIPVAATIAQLINLILYVLFAKKILKEY